MVCDFRALISPHIQICRSTVGIMSLRFNSDGTFRVLQMADIQDGPDVREDTIRLIEAAIRKAHPDLIVLTGDQIRGYDPAYIDTFLRRRGEQPGTHVRAVTEIEAKIRGIKRHPIAKTLTKSQPSDERWMIDGIGTDSPKLVKSAGRNGSASKLESWAEAINRVTAASLLDETRQKVRDTFAAFLGPALESRIPFAATYGNHDFQCGILADEQDDLYREFAGCMNPVAGSSPLALEPGTFALPIEASDGSGRITMSVMMVNSGDYADTADAGDGNGRQSVTEYAKYAANSRGWDLADSDGYGTPSPEAVEWLKDVQRELGRRNGDGQAVPAIAFQHIPPQEFYDCLREVPAYTPNAVEGARTFAGHCYVLDRDVCRPGSRLGEAIGCADVNVGDSVLAIGNPLGELTFSMSGGYVSSCNRAINVDGTPFNMIQVDCSINPGNSGGPLMNLYGEVVGIVSAKYSSYSDTTVEGIGFAIPISDVQTIITDIMENGQVTDKAYMAIKAGSMTEQMAAQYNIDVTKGVFVYAVEKGGAGEKAGLQLGDVITKLNDTDITSMSDLSMAKKSYKAGDTVTLTVWRGGQEITLSLTFDQQPQTTGTEGDSSNQNQGQQDSYGDLYDYFFGRGNGGRGN